LGLSLFFYNYVFESDPLNKHHCMVFMIEVYGPTMLTSERSTEVYVSNVKVNIFTSAIFRGISPKSAKKCINIRGHHS